MCNLFFLAFEAVFISFYLFVGLNFPPRDQQFELYYFSMITSKFSSGFQQDFSLLLIWVGAFLVRQSRNFEKELTPGTSPTRDTD